jgi:DNA-binding response OmpR family regulator
VGADRRGRVFVVDNEPDITSIIKRGLEAAGYAVDAYNDPELALAGFRPGYYDMLILDIRVPKFNGFQLYSEIRKKDTKAKVCFMTAFEVYRGVQESVPGLRRKVLYYKAAQHKRAAKDHRGRTEKN